jgi:hypothetical protein
MLDDRRDRFSPSSHRIEEHPYAESKARSIKTCDGVRTACLPERSVWSGERIYHLPFDQMYDRTVIGNMPGERYVHTVREAEGLGFRRAFRWRPDGELSAVPGA